MRRRREKQTVVIFFGGYIGSGKTSLAKAISERLGILYYEVDLIKKVVIEEDPSLEYNVKQNIPFPDEARIRMFNKVVEDFADLSKTHTCLIADETLHKKATRRVLFDGATKYFGGYMVVWVQADEKTIKERLGTKERTDHVLGDPYGMYLSMKKIFEPLDKADIVFENTGSLDEAADRLATLIREKIECLR
ncbi:MAG: dephospho-CoA kinase [Syntrophorhabdus sp. PtaU1.Bin002]|nr:MAG: dephospho-CoA kinase [Syntrophorhabdus sp. PtaB.Bin006]OPY69626.1 MAG: dephospho-CoA kinase [Syntrophorhabdus sp. PtaU1.Bin002]